MQDTEDGQASEGEQLFNVQGISRDRAEKAGHEGQDLEKEIRPPKGWYIDKESVRQGENKLTGQPYRTYILFRIQRE